MHFLLVYIAKSVFYDMPINISYLLTCTYLNEQTIFKSWFLKSIKMSIKHLPDIQDNLHDELQDLITCMSLSNVNENGQCIWQHKCTFLC